MPSSDSLDRSTTATGSTSTSTRWGALLLAIGIVAFVFPDVLFLGSSFRNSRVAGIFVPPRPVVDPLSGGEPGFVRDGYRDIGGAAFQLEPSILFMRRVIWRGESPYWNPYGATGTLGPERLASSQFSLLVVSTALLGGGARAIHGVLLVAMVASLYFLFRTLTVFFGRSKLAGAGAAVAFLMTGFHMSMLGSQMVQPYLLAPLLLYALVALAKEPTAGRFAWAALANAVLLAETFLPTTVLVLVTVNALALSYGLSSRTGAKSEAVRCLTLQAASAAFGLLIAAPLWLPILESLEHVSLDHYTGSTTTPIRPRAMLSVVTPKHFWRSYGAFERTRSFTDEAFLVGRLESTRVYHLGVLSLFLAIQAFGSPRVRRQPLVILSAALMVASVGRVFGLPPFTLLGDLPVLRTFNLQYWGVLLCLPFPVLLAYGIDAWSTQTVGAWPTLVWLALTVLAVVYLAGAIGLPPTGLARTDVGVLVALLFTAAAVSAFVRFMPHLRLATAVAVVLLMAGELTFYVNHARPTRMDYDFERLPLVSFMRARLGLARVLTMGARGLPPNWGSALEIPQIDSLDSVSLARWADFFDARFGRTQQFLAIRNTRVGDSLERVEAGLDLKALDLLGVRYVIVARELQSYRRFLEDRGYRVVLEIAGAFVLENASAYPRAFVVERLVEGSGVPSDLGLAGDRVASTEDRSLLARAEQLGLLGEAPGSEETDASSSNAAIVRYGHARVEIEVTLARPGLVVLTDTWHPSWRATLDGEPAHLGRVNAVLRGVLADAGPHRIVMTYRPRSLWVAAIASVAAMSFLAATVARAHRSRAATGPAPAA